MTPEFQHLKYLERGRKPSSRRSHLFKLFKYFPMYNLGIAEVLHHINTEMVVKAIMTVTYRRRISVMWVVVGAMEWEEVVSPLFRAALPRFQLSMHNKHRAALM